MIPQDLAHLSTEELITEVERRAYERGRQAGYSEGIAHAHQQSFDEGFAQGHKVGHRQGYDAGRQKSHRQRKNDAVRDEGIRFVREQLTTIRNNIDQMLSLEGLGSYNTSGMYRK